MYIQSIDVINQRMSNGIKYFIIRMLYLYLLIDCYLVSATEKKEKKRRCKKVCKTEFDDLKQRVQELEAKLNLLLATNAKLPEIQYVRGPKGERGEVGPQGPQGPKGDRGYMGLQGRAGKDGYAISRLPRCNAGEYISSDGNDLFCLKLGTVLRPSIATTPRTIQTTTAKWISPDGTRLESPPTIAAEMEKEMTKFTKKYMIQTLYADTWDLHSFVWQQNAYLGISQLSSKTFTLYKWVEIVGYVEKAVLTIANARKWTSFEWKGSLYIVIACNTRGTDNSPGFSYIYKMSKYDSVELFQKVSTSTAFGVDTIEKNGEMFIIFLYLYGQKSDIFKWRNDRFVLHQTVGVGGTDIDAFHIGDRTFISSVGTTSREPYAYLMEYNGDKFVPFKNIDIETRSYGIKHIKIGKDHFLAVARYDLPRSLILKWNGETFEEFQQIDSCKARNFATITTHQMGKQITYLAVINYACKPVIYIYDEKVKKFLKLQQTDSEGTRDIEFLRMPNRDKVYLAVSSNKQTAIYAGSAS